LPYKLELSSESRNALTGIETIRSRRFIPKLVGNTSESRNALTGIETVGVCAQRVRGQCQSESRNALTGIETTFLKLPQLNTVCLNQEMP